MRLRINLTPLIFNVRKHIYLDAIKTKIYSKNLLRINFV